MVVYTVHDTLAHTYSYPQVSPTVASAVRDFRALLAKVGPASDDLECLYVGEWIADKGEYHPGDVKVIVPAKSPADSNGVTE